MDCKRDWHQDCAAPLADFSTHGANYLCHSDGGTRVNSCSAAGWFIEAIVVRGDYRHTFPIAMRGIYLQDPVSSFLAEAIALEDAISFLKHHVQTFRGSSP